MRTNLKSGLHWGGSALAIAGVVFVVLRLRDYGEQINFDRFGLPEWIILGSFTLVYSVSNLILPQAWRRLLSKFGAPVTYRWAVRVYGISQLAKYVPGNIFHLAGRQAIGMAAGLPGWPLAKSSVWELGLLTLAGAMFGVLALPLVVSSVSVSNVAITFVVTVIASAILLGRYSGQLAARAFVWYVCFFSASAAIFVGLIKLVSSLSLSDASMWLAFGGAYVLAWLAGFITPGAPAGVGVRELVLLFLLKGEIAEADLVFIILLGRMVTVLGDFLFFLSSSIISKRNF